MRLEKHVSHCIKKYHCYGHLSHFRLLATTGCGCYSAILQSTKVDLWRCDGLWASSVLAEEPLDLKVLEGKEFGAGDLSGSQGRLGWWPQWMLDRRAAAVGFLCFERIYGNLRDFWCGADLTDV